MFLVMPTDQVYRKSGSPQASTEVSSLQLNRTKNKEGKSITVINTS